MSETYWEQRYQYGHIPWDTGKPDFNLISMVLRRPIMACRTLEIGCGTGSNAIWLAQNGFTVTGTDISETAIQMANDNALMKGVNCQFFRADFLKDEIFGQPYGFAFDRACFDCFDTDEERSLFARNVWRHLRNGGLWLSLIGSADALVYDDSTPRRTARDIVVAVEPLFEVLWLTTIYFDSNRPRQPRAWECLMRKRKEAVVCT